MALTAARWTKYGNDRTYLNVEDGTSVAWIDNRTGAVTIQDGMRRAEIEQWLGTNSPGTRIAVPPTLSALALPTQPSPNASGSAHSPVAHARDIDLASNRYGQGVRARAEEELAAMRSRSKVGTFLARAFDVNTEERQWRTGAKGEETIGARLEKLRGAGWHVLHAVPIGSRGSDIDHLLIGPGGVWTINTKNHPGKRVWVAASHVRVDGHPQPYIRNSEYEAARVRKILTQRLGWEPFVKAALVFMTGTLVPDVTIKSKPENVEVLDRMDIPGVFKRSTGRLGHEQIDAIFEIARWQSTWTSGPK